MARLPLGASLVAIDQGHFSLLANATAPRRSVTLVSPPGDGGRRAPRMAFVYNSARGDRSEAALTAFC